MTSRCTHRRAPDGSTRSIHPRCSASPIPPSPAGERMAVKLVRDQIRQRHHPEHGDIPHHTTGAAHTTPPRVVTVDKNPAYPVAFEAVRHEGLVRPRSNLRQCKYLNNIIEQDHRFIKRRTRPMLGFKRFTTAWRTLRGLEIMHALRKGQARWMAKGDVVGQTQLIHKVFGLAA